MTFEQPHGTPEWAMVIAIRIVAKKYASEVDAIKAELMFAYAQGYQDAGKDKETIQSQERSNPNV